MQAESQWNIKYLIQLAKLVTNILRKTKIVCEAGAPHPSSPRADSTNKWYQRDMITGRRLLSDQRRPTKGGGENFSNPAESLTQKGTISKLSHCARATRGVFQSKCGLWFAPLRVSSPQSVPLLRRKQPFNFAERYSKTHM